MDAIKWIKRGVKKLTKIDVNINAETGEIGIRNNGVVLTRNC